MGSGFSIMTVVNGYQRSVFRKTLCNGGTDPS
jgi:hypothetical protein